MSGNKLLKVYHRLPSPARSAVASLRGYYLNWSRYGGGTEEQVEAALERERWSREKLADLQSERLAYILERAAVKVPFYRQEWSNKNIGDRKSLVNWSVLKKKSLRGN